MKITPDTNVLLRALTDDDPAQAKAAQAELANASLVALTLPTLCELVWVLSRQYKAPRSEVADVIRRLVNAANVVSNRAAIYAGLAVLDAGGDFADGVIAFEGSWLGSDAFVSFDHNAVRLIEAQGRPARLPVAPDG